MCHILWRKLVDWFSGGFSTENSSEIHFINLSLNFKVIQNHFLALVFASWIRNNTGCGSQKQTASSKVFEWQNWRHFSWFTSEIAVVGPQKRIMIFIELHIHVFFLSFFFHLHWTSIFYTVNVFRFPIGAPFFFLPGPGLKPTSTRTTMLTASNGFYLLLEIWESIPRRFRPISIRKMRGFDHPRSVGFYRNGGTPKKGP